MTTLLLAVNTFPPALVRAVARKTSGGSGQTSPLTAAEIAILTGIPLGRVRRYLSRDDWSETVAELSKIFELLGVEFSCHCQKQKQYLRRTSRKSWPMAHLAKLSKRDRERILGRLNV